MKFPQIRMKLSQPTAPPHCPGSSKAPFCFLKDFPKVLAINYYSYLISLLYFLCPFLWTDREGRSCHLYSYIPFTAQSITFKSKCDVIPILDKYVSNIKSLIKEDI